MSAISFRNQHGRLVTVYPLSIAEVVEPDFEKLPPDRGMLVLVSGKVYGFYKKEDWEKVVGYMEGAVARRKR